MTERSQAFYDAIAATAALPSAAAELPLPPVNPYERAEKQAFIDGALYANDYLLDAWRLLEEHEPNRMIDAVKAMLVHAINAIGDEARLEASYRYPLFDKPSERDIKLGKFVPVQQ